MTQSQTEETQVLDSAHGLVLAATITLNEPDATRGLATFELVNLTSDHALLTAIEVQVEAERMTISGTFPQFYDVLPTSRGAILTAEQFSGAAMRHHEWRAGALLADGEAQFTFHFVTPQGPTQLRGRVGQVRSGGNQGLSARWVLARRRPTELQVQPRS